MSLNYEKEIHPMNESFSITAFWVLAKFLTFLYFQMTVNPWQVDSIQDFYFLKCPECLFDTQKEEFFQDHAIENHPLSFVLFGKKIKEEAYFDVEENEENGHFG